MESQARGDVEFQISVMHAMQSPEHGHDVKHHMLAVDDDIEQKHGGRISVTSEVGVGTTFVIRIPIGGHTAQSSKEAA